MNNIEQKKKKKIKKKDQKTEERHFLIIELYVNIFLPYL